MRRALARLKCRAQRLVVPIVRESSVAYSVNFVRQFGPRPVICSWVPRPFAIFHIQFYRYLNGGLSSNHVSHTPQAGQQQQGIVLELRLPEALVPDGRRPHGIPRPVPVQGVLGGFPFRLRLQSTSLKRAPETFHMLQATANIALVQRAQVAGPYFSAYVRCFSHRQEGGLGKQHGNPATR